MLVAEPVAAAMHAAPLDPTAPLVPLDPPAVTTPGVTSFAGVPGVSGETGAVLGSVNSLMADAWTIAEDPLGPMTPEVAAAMQRAHAAGGAAAALEGAQHEQGVLDEVLDHDQRWRDRETLGRSEFTAWQAANTPGSGRGTFGG